NGFAPLAEAQVQVADPVEEAELDLAALRLSRPERLLVRPYRPVPLLPLLVLTGLFLQPGDGLHRSFDSQSFRVARCSARRRDKRRDGWASASRNRSAAAESTSSSGSIPMTSVSVTWPPHSATSVSIRSTTRIGETASMSSRFIEIWVSPRSGNSRARARSPGNPPPVSRIVAAIDFAASCETPSTKTFHARRIFRA